MGLVHYMQNSLKRDSEMGVRSILTDKTWRFHCTVVIDCAMMSNRQEYVETDECCMFLDHELSGHPTEVFCKISVPLWNSARTPKQLCESWRNRDCEESEIRRKFCETPVFEEPFAHGGSDSQKSWMEVHGPLPKTGTLFDYLWPKWSALFPTLFMNWPKIDTLLCPDHKNKRPSQFNVSFPIARPTHFFGKVKKKKFQNNL